MSAASLLALAGSLLFFGWLALITPPFALLACAIAWLPPLVRYRIIAVWSRLAVGALALLCGVRYRVQGAENIPPRPVVFLSRHESAWETIAYQVILPPQAFVLKKTLLHIPFFGWGLRQMSPIAIDRRRPLAAARQLRRQGAARLAAGFSVVVFPEGTRLAAGEQRRWHSGGAQLAKENAAAVLPVAVNSGACWGRNRFIKRRGCITVAIGEPIASEGLSAEEINARAQAWIAQAMAAMG